jgi:rubrerythrin
MPEFSSIFSVKKSDRKLTDDELIRAIRFNIAAEYEAVQLYTQLAESTDNELAITVLNDVAREELVHAGEFLKLLMQLAPDEMKAYEEGYGEVEEMMEKIKKGK